MRKRKQLTMNEVFHTCVAAAYSAALIFTQVKVRDFHSLPRRRERRKFCFFITFILNREHIYVSYTQYCRDVRFGPLLLQIGTNRTNLGLSKIRFLFILPRRSKCTESILKSSQVYPIIWGQSDPI